MGHEEHNQGVRVAALAQCGGGVGHEGPQFRDKTQGQGQSSSAWREMGTSLNHSGKKRGNGKKRLGPGEGALPSCTHQVNILLNVQLAIRNKHSANMFLFIVLGIFLLCSLKGSPHPSPPWVYLQTQEGEIGFSGQVG